MPKTTMIDKVNILWKLNLSWLKAILLAAAKFKKNLVHKEETMANDKDLHSNHLMLTIVVSVWHI